MSHVYEKTNIKRLKKIKTEPFKKDTPRASWMPILYPPWDGLIAINYGYNHRNHPRTDAKVGIHLHRT